MLLLSYNLEVSCVLIEKPEVAKYEPSSSSMMCTAERKKESRENAYACIRNVCVLYTYCMRIVYVLYAHCMRSVCVLYAYCIRTLRILYPYCMRSVCVLYAYIMNSLLLTFTVRCYTWRYVPDALTLYPCVKLYFIPGSVKPSVLLMACWVMISSAISSAVKSDELLISVTMSAITLPRLKDITKQDTKLSLRPPASKATSNCGGKWIERTNISLPMAF